MKPQPAEKQKTIKNINDDKWKKNFIDWTDAKSETKTTWMQQKVMVWEPPNNLKQKIEPGEAIEWI